MNWIRVALTVFAGGFVASLTDWLFMGDWLYQQYNQNPEIWRHPHGQGEMMSNGKASTGCSSNCIPQFTASYSLGWLVKLVVAAVAVTLILR